MVMIDETEGIEFDSDGRGCSVTLLTEDGQSLRGLADRAGIWTELEERHPGLTPERILQGDHAVFGCIVIHDNLRAHGDFGMEFDGDAAFGRFELTDVELNMLGKKLPRLADTDELKAFFSHAGGGGGRLTQSERSTAYGRHEPDANTVSDISEYLKDALTEYRNAPSWMRRDPWSDDPIENFIGYLRSGYCPATTRLHSAEEHRSLEIQSENLSLMLGDARKLNDKLEQHHALADEHDLDDVLTMDDGTAVFLDDCAMPDSRGMVR